MFSSLKHNPYYSIQVAQNAATAQQTDQVNKIWNIKLNMT